MIRRQVMRRSVAALIALGPLALPCAGAAQVLTLGEALDAALDTHPTLAAADARMLAAQGAEDAARAARLPGAAVSATLTRFEEPMVVAPLHSLSPGNPPAFDRSLVQSQIAARYTLFDAGARSSRIRAAGAAFEGSRTLRGVAEMRLLEETTGAYLGALTARAVVDAATAQVSALSAERDRAQRHFDAGSAAQVDVLMAEAVLQEARAEEASAAARMGMAERALARMMGVEPTAVSAHSLAEVDLSAGPLRAGARGADGSPVVRQAELSVVAAEARLAEERAARFPTLQAGAGLLDFGTAAGDHVVEWRAGLELSWPVYTGGARGAAVRRTSSEVAAARADRETARLQVAEEIDAAETALLEARARTDALTTAVAQWEEVARIEALALETGSGEQRDLLRAQAGLFQARAGQAVARRDAALAQVQLARAEGVLSRDWLIETMEASR